MVVHLRVAAAAAVMAVMNCHSSSAAGAAVPNTIVPAAVATLAAVSCKPAAASATTVTLATSSTRAASRQIISLRRQCNAAIDQNVSRSWDAIATGTNAVAAAALWTSLGVASGQARGGWGRACLLHAMRA